MKSKDHIVRCLFVVTIATLPACIPQDQGLRNQTAKEDGKPIDVRRELERRVSFYRDQTDVKSAIANVLGLGSSRLGLCRQLFVDGTPEGVLDVTLKDVIIKTALDELTRKAHLRWTIRAESVFVGTSGQIKDIERTTSALEEVDSPILRKQLDGSFCFCTPGGTPLAEILRFLGECRGIKFVVRSSVDDSAQRFGTFDFTGGIRMRNLVRFLAVNWRFDLEVEGDSVVFVPKKPQ